MGLRNTWSVILLIGLLTGGCSKQSQVWIPGWKETSALSIARAGAAVVVNKDIIYMIGGVDGHDFLRTTEYARIQKDGTLSPWQPSAPLNEERGFFEGVVHNGWIYVVGGGNGPNGHNLLRSVERSKIQSDGSLGPWIAEPNAMLIPRRCSKVIATDEAIYSFGGFGGALLDTVEHAVFAADGSLDPWAIETEAMTMPRYVDGVKMIGPDTYVIGGHDQSRGVGVTNVERSRVGTARAHEKWRATSALQTGRYGLATASHGQTIYALGGLTGAEYLNSIERSTRDSSGELSAWETTTPLAQPLTNFSVVVHDDRIYVISGTNASGYSRSVYFASFDKNGDIGYWGSAQEAQAHEQARAARAAQASNLPNEGIVREVQQAQAYTYAMVEGPNGLTWLAGPKTELAIGTHIRYSQGVLMTNFYSKELQRSFPQVIFVGTIAPQ